MSIRAIAAVAAAFALVQCAPTHALGRNVDVRIVDRASGETLPLYRYQGKWWVAGRPGSGYAISITNHSGGRVLAVMSVDGVNVVSGETAAHGQSGYVLSRGQSAQISGWRKDLSRVAAFEFTALSNSYAALTGRPDHVGVIGVAVFHEKQRPQVAPPIVEEPYRSSRRGDAPAAPAASTQGSDAAAPAAESAQRAESRQSPDRLGTRHGRSEYSPSSTTAFERAHSTPDELITIHYDSRENLIALGVIPTPRVPHPVPNPFPAAAGFVPDPPRR